MDKQIAENEGAFVDLLNQEMKELQESQKQIEEIQKILEYCCNEYDEKGRRIRNKCNSCDCEYYDETNGICASYSLKEARALYNAGYRKIPENAVVVPDMAGKYFYAVEKSEWDKMVQGAKDIIHEREENTRKETAERFAERLKASLDISVEGYSTSEVMSEIEDKIDEILKEITEDKV